MNELSQIQDTHEHLVDDLFDAFLACNEQEHAIVHCTFGVPAGSLMLAAKVNASRTVERGV